MVGKELIVTEWLQKQGQLRISTAIYMQVAKPRWSTSTNLRMYLFATKSDFHWYIVKLVGVMSVLFFSPLHWQPWHVGKETYYPP